MYGKSFSSRNLHFIFLLASSFGYWNWVVEPWQPCRVPAIGTLSIPWLSVSIGIPEYPRDGLTIDHLLCFADQALYGEKHRRADRASITQST